MDFMNSVNAVFRDKRVLQKLGIIAGIFFLNSIISSILNLVLNFASYIPFSDELQAYSYFLSYGTTIFTSLLTFPLWLYVRGYAYQIADSIRTHGLKSPLPEHNTIKKTLSVGGVFLTFQYICTFPLMIVASVPLIFGFIAFYSSDMSRFSLSSIGMVAIIVGGVVIMILSLITMMLFSLFVVPSMMYLYLKSGSLREAFSIRNVRNVVNAGWSQLLLYAGITVLLNIAGGVLTLVLCCIPVIAPALIQTLLFAITSAILGSIYYNLDLKLDVQKTSL